MTAEGEEASAAEARADEGAGRRDPAPNGALESVPPAATPAVEARASDVPPPADGGDDDLAFPGEAPPRPVDPREADAEAKRVAEATARNQRATAAAVVFGFVVATAVFFGIAYAFPESERGFSLLAVALGAGAFVGIAVWAALRSKAPVFDVGPLPAAAPVDAETLRLEAAARAHDRRIRIALSIAGGVFFFAGPLGLYGWEAHVEALNETRSYWDRETVGMGTRLLWIAGAAAVSAAVFWLLRPKVDVLSELGGATVEKDGAPAKLSKAELAELRAVAAEVRANQRREALAHGGAVVVFLVVAPLVMFAGGGLVLAAVAGGLAAVGFSRFVGGMAPAPKLEKLEIPDRGRDWFRETLSSTSSITLEVPGDLESMLGRFVGVAVNRWTVIDAGGAAMAEASEVELPLLRRFLPFRPRTVAVRDLDRVPLELVRGGGPFDGVWRLSAEKKAAGSIETTIFGSLVLREPGGVERFRVRRSFLFARTRAIVRAGQEIGRIEWPRAGLFSTRLDRPGLVIEMPQETSYEDRRLLLAAGLVLDLDRA